MTYIKRSVDNYERLVANLPSVFCQKDSKWEYIDDRFKSHYGSTFEIPTSEYTTRNNISGTLAVVCDKYVLIDKVQFPEYSEDNSLEDYLVMNLGEPVDYVSFVDILTTTFHNLTIDVVGNYSSTATIYNTLDDVLNYLAIHTPQYLIFNGVEGSLLSGLSFDDCIQKLNQINSICIDNSINALLLFTPNYDIMNIDKSKYQELVCTYFSNLDIFDLGNWFIHHLSLDRLDRSSFDSQVAKWCDKHYGYINTDSYNIVVYNVIKHYVLEKFFLLTRTSFFISFVTLNIDNSTYCSTVKYYDNTPTAKVFGRKYTGKDNTKGLSTELDEHDTVFHPGDVQVHFMSKYGSDNRWNIFSNEGELIEFGIHTSYDETRYMAQQLQCNCSEEFQKGRESAGVRINNLMPLRKYCTGAVTYEMASFPPPPFPGTGCPWITISERNKSDYIDSTGRYCRRYVYYTKDDYSYTITVKLHTNSGLPDLWQTVSVGMMSTQSTENYPFPLYACGGTQALKQDHYQYYPITGGNLTYLQGNSYDLDMDNICLCNSNPLHSTKFNGSESSTFKFLAPEGIWYPIFVHSQSVHGILSNPRIGGPPSDYASPLGEPSATISGVCTIYPNANDSRYTTYIDGLHRAELEPYCKVPYKYGTKFENLTIANESSMTHNSKIIVGTIPNLYRCWDYDLPCGEVVIEGVRYLSIPNGWEHRMWHYPWHYNVYNDEWQIDTIREMFEDICMPKRYKIFNDRLLIKLGDAEIDS